MQNVIEYKARWSNEFGVGLLRITNQKYRGVEFNNGHVFQWKEITIMSDLYPAFLLGTGIESLYVRGTDKSKDNDTLVYQGTEDKFGRILDALDAYNEQRPKMDRKVDNIAFHKAIWEKLAGDPKLVKEDIVLNMCRLSNIPVPKNDCFLCEEAYQNNRLDCSKCRGYWGIDGMDNPDGTCMKVGSYYYMWMREKDMALKSALAMKIANNVDFAVILPEELELAFQKGMVPAIKAHRNRTGMGLKESKALMEEAIEKDGRPYVVGGYQRIDCTAEELKMVRSGYIMQTVLAYQKRTGKSFTEAKKCVYSWLD